MSSSGDPRVLLPASLPVSLWVCLNGLPFLFPQLPAPAWTQQRVPSPSLSLMRAWGSDPRGPGEPWRRPCVLCVRELDLGSWRGHRNPSARAGDSQGRMAEEKAAGPQRKDSVPTVILSSGMSSALHSCPAPDLGPPQKSIGRGKS